ncbi:MAG: hypothetical protein K1X48_12555 [Burkholderiaceae bacterium]|nr:hypothetical protein [Burkholderiaceae bacterium]
MNISTVLQRGECQVGWFFSWRYAWILIMDRFLKVSLFAGDYTFVPSEVQVIEPIGLSILSTGIRIHHKKPHYPKRIIFFSRDPDSLLLAAAAAGFPARQ